MDSPRWPASSDKSLEEKLSQCVAELEKRNLTIICKPVSSFLPFNSPNGGDEASPNRGNEASPNLHHERGFKCNASRGTNEKMGPRPAVVGKHRQQRHTSKGTIKVYPADLSNFRALVHEHTSQLPSAPPPDVAAHPTSPLTPHSITSASSACGFASQPSSPTTPHSIPSSSTSPLSSPHHGHPSDGRYLNGFPFEGHVDVPFPFELHAEHDSHLNTHLNVHHVQCNVNQSLNPDYNTNPRQSTYMPGCASMPYLGDSYQADDVPREDGLPQGISPDQFARILSLKRFLFENDAGCNSKCV